MPLASLTVEARVAAATRSPSSLVVLYDAHCPICVRCHRWLAAQDTYVPLTFLATDEPEAARRFGPHLPWLGQELIVVGDDAAWVGPSAFLVALWATVDYRIWSYRLSGPALAPLARAFFETVSHRRRGLGRWLTPQPTTCPDDRCGHRR